MTTIKTSAVRASQISSLVEETRKLEKMGNVTLAEQNVRTLDDLAGRWVDGRYVGGSALVRGTAEVVSR